MGLGRLADEALERFEGLPGKLAMKFADLLQLGHRILVSPFHEFGLDFHRLVERANTAELLEKRPELLERFPGVVAIGVRDRLQADWRSFGRRVGWRGSAGTGSAGEGTSAGQGGSAETASIVGDRGSATTAHRAASAGSGLGSGSALGNLRCSGSGFCISTGAGLSVSFRFLAPRSALADCVARTSPPVCSRLYSTSCSPIPMSNQRSKLRHVCAGIAVLACQLQGTGVMTFWRATAADTILHKKYW